MRSEPARVLVEVDGATWEVWPAGARREGEWFARSTDEPDEIRNWHVVTHTPRRRKLTCVLRTHAAFEGRQRCPAAHAVRKSLDVQREPRP